MSIFYKKGITAVELLIVLSIFVALFSIILPQFSKIKENQVLKSTTGDILSILSNTRSKTLGSANSSEYGVHFQSDRVIIFKGKIYSSNGLGNETINITAPISISNVTFGEVSGTSGDLYFNRLLGVPSTTGTITISAPSIFKVITIYATGVASIN